MSDDFYCDEVLSGRTTVAIVAESERVLAFHHTRPTWAEHIVVIPKRHVPSFTHLGPDDDELLLELMHTVQAVAGGVLERHGACRVVTNLGRFQESKHLHWHVGSGDPVTDGPAAKL